MRLFPAYCCRMLFVFCCVRYQDSESQQWWWELHTFGQRNVVYYELYGYWRAIIRIILASALGRFLWAFQRTPASRCAFFCGWWDFGARSGIVTLMHQTKTNVWMMCVPLVLTAAVDYSYEQFLPMVYARYRFVCCVYLCFRHRCRRSGPMTSPGDQEEFTSIAAEGVIFCWQGVIGGLVYMTVQTRGERKGSRDPPFIKMIIFLH